MLQWKRWKREQIHSYKSKPWSDCSFDQTYLYWYLAFTQEPRLFIFILCSTEAVLSCFSAREMTRGKFLQVLQKPKRLWHYRLFNMTKCSFYTNLRDSWRSMKARPVCTCVTCHACNVNSYSFKRNSCGFNFCLIFEWQ